MHLVQEAPPRRLWRRLHSHRSSIDAGRHGRARARAVGHHPPVWRWQNP